MTYIYRRPVRRKYEDEEKKLIFLKKSYIHRRSVTSIQTLKEQLKSFCLENICGGFSI